MTHDCDRAAECPCYQAGYLNGQQTGEWTLAALVDSFELTAGRMAVAALIIPPALYPGRRVGAVGGAGVRQPSSVRRHGSNGGHGPRATGYGHGGG